MIAHSPGLSFADNCVVVVISSFADRKLCRANLHVSLRAVAFHATLLRTIVSLVTGSEHEFRLGIQESFISSLSIPCYQLLVLIYVRIVFDNGQSRPVRARIGITTEPTFLTKHSTGDFRSRASGTTLYCYLVVTNFPFMT